MDQSRGSLARTQIQFYVSEIAKRDHRIQQLQAALQALKQQLAKSDLSLLAVELNHQKQQNAVLKQQLDLLQEQAQARISQKINRIQDLEKDLAYCRKRLQEAELISLRSPLTEPLVQLISNAKNNDFRIEKAKALSHNSNSNSQNNNLRQQPKKKQALRPSERVQRKYSFNVSSLGTQNTPSRQRLKTQAGNCKQLKKKEKSYCIILKKHSMECARKVDDSFLKRPFK